MTTRRTHTTYPTIRSEGGLLPPDLLDRVLRQDINLGGLDPRDYGLAPGARLLATISEAWGAIQLHAASFRRTMELVGREGGSGTTETRAYVQQILRELGYRELRFVPAAETVEGRAFLISHRAGEAENAPPIHIVSFKQKLDERAERTGGGELRSPHALLQGYLNASDHLWGIVTNGLSFRILRENRQIDRSLLLNVDLGDMLEAESFHEFQLFWLLLHRSRLVHPGERRETAWLERWSQTAASEGARALTGLRAGVERAIEALGQGLLEHPRNIDLRDQLASGRLSIDDYYGQLLRLVYRFLFLLVAEERGLLFPDTAEQRTIDRYRKHYSIERLRAEASRVRPREAHHDDLWRGLLITFDAMCYREIAHSLGLEPLGGGLFGSGSCPNVADNAAPGTEYTGDRTAGRPLLANAALLAAVEALSEVTRDGITRRINYRDLDVEELGGVYEGLLERRPALEPLPHGGYRFGYSASTSRKETGSYYTPRSLVQELLTSALDPVIDAALAAAATDEAKERALLDLNVCDPACGSGHFLLGAARRIGRRLAEVRAGAGREPEPGAVRHAVAEAIRRCVYGVDKNPLAIDLCKVALWIESHEPGGPIGFLDHHIKRGDSLVGVFDLDVLTAGIPDGAYTPVTGDDKKVAASLKGENRDQRPKITNLGEGRAAPVRTMGLFEESEREDILRALAARLREIEVMPETTITEVEAKAAQYARIHARDDWDALSRACDLWTWAFFAPLTPETRHLVPTSAAVRDMIQKGNVRRDLVGAAHASNVQIGYFHWRLEFPDVFGATQGGGFDAVLGNPPWDQVQLDPGEFFATRRPEISMALNMAARNRLIDKLGESTNEADVTVFREFRAARHLMDGVQKFIHESQRYPLTSIGRINTAPLFTEHARRLVSATGQAGVIVPSGIATDSFTQKFFADMVKRASLAALYDFENRRAIFEGVHRSYKFSLLVIAGAARQDSRFRVGFFLLDPLEIHEPDKTFFLAADDISLLNPNTLTCPIFRNAQDAEIATRIYRSVPVLVHETEPEINRWGVKFKIMFMINTDSHLLRTHSQFESEEFALDARNVFRSGDDTWLPVYEAKLIHQYDHRFATYGNDGTDDRVRDLAHDEHINPQAIPFPRYWIGSGVMNSRISNLPRGDQGWLTAFRGVTRNTDQRTSIFSLVPATAVADPLMIAAVDCNARLQAAFLANANAIPFDYLARQKMSGAHLTFFVLKQLPVLPPETYTQDLLDLIVPRVLELTYTAHDMAPFARDLGYDGPPFVWDEERRAQLRADLDGIYAHLYGISRDDFAYILDTFPIVARNDIARHGEFRTKRLCLAAYDHFAPETLRALELEVRRIEVELRRLIDRSLGGNIDDLPPSKKEKLLEIYRQSPAGARANHEPALRDLLEWTTLEDLDPMLKSEKVWPQIGQFFTSKRNLVDYLGSLRDFRNPMAHSRGLSEAERVKGEEALAKFTSMLQQTR